jgi:hypothetical protein
MLMYNFGKAVDKQASSEGCSIVATWGSHSIHMDFHPPRRSHTTSSTRPSGAASPARPPRLTHPDAVEAQGDVLPDDRPDNWTNMMVDGKRTGLAW